jgi:hypothetical protein
VQLPFKDGCPSNPALLSQLTADKIFMTQLKIGQSDDACALDRVRLPLTNLDSENLLTADRLKYQAELTGGEHPSELIG